MESDRLADMSLEDLKGLIEKMIDERLQLWPGQLQERPVSEILAEMRQTIWTRPVDGKSSLDLLREDRSR